MKYIHECPECGAIKDCSVAIRSKADAEYVNTHCIGIETYHVAFLGSIHHRYIKYYEKEKGFHPPVKMDIYKLDNETYYALFSLGLEE